MNNYIKKKIWALFLILCTYSAFSQENTFLADKVTITPPCVKIGVHSTLLISSDLFKGDKNLIFSLKSSQGKIIPLEAKLTKDGKWQVTITGLMFSGQYNLIINGPLTSEIVVSSGVTVVKGDIISANIGTLDYIPLGTFQRDANASNVSTVSPYYMSEAQITQKQFKTLTGFLPLTNRKDDNRPVVDVSWYEAVEYCNDLSSYEGLKPVYTITKRIPAAGYPIESAEVKADWTANGYRLPTEMEYIWAAMGATLDSTYSGDINTEGYTKAFAGNDRKNNIFDYVVFASIFGPSSLVKTKLPNELGLYDMSGNAWSWCWDWMADYPSDILTNYKGPASGSNHVIHGGSWRNLARHVSIAARGTPQMFKLDPIGFRVVRNDF